MKVIQATNVNMALVKALMGVRSEGLLQSSRNGTVLVYPTPVSTVYIHPDQRVLFSPMRRANHAFHLLEALWMLAGRGDVGFVSKFVSNMKNYSDDQRSLWGAYGYRWRNFFGFDQIESAITELRKNPESRRVVLSMWNAMNTREALPDHFVAINGGKDVPCNTHIYLSILEGMLNMTVCCRSNDILWGAYGANAVHMSFLQEYIAGKVGVGLGTYTQMSNNLHLYNSTIPEQGIEVFCCDVTSNDLYHYEGVRTTPLFKSDYDIEKFDRDLNRMFTEYDLGGTLTDLSDLEYEGSFFRGTVQPVLRSWLLRKSKPEALLAAQGIEGDDWRAGMLLWLAGAAK